MWPEHSPCCFLDFLQQLEDFQSLEMKNDLCTEADKQLSDSVEEARRPPGPLGPRCRLRLSTTAVAKRGPPASHGVRLSARGSSGATIVTDVGGQIFSCVGVNWFTSEAHCVELVHKTSLCKIKGFHIGDAATKSLPRASNCQSRLITNF